MGGGAGEADGGGLKGGGWGGVGGGGKGGGDGGGDDGGEGGGGLGGGGLLQYSTQLTRQWPYGRSDSSSGITSTQHPSFHMDSLRWTIVVP